MKAREAQKAMKLVGFQPMARKHGRRSRGLG